MNPKQSVICICGGDGFPKGSATAVRITLVGKSLQAAGLNFELLHCGPSPSKLNTRASGFHEGVRFRYTTFLHRPSNYLLRIGAYAIAVGNVTLSLIWHRLRGNSPVVYLYVMHGILNLYIGTICRTLGLPLVQELCEWWPGEPTCSALTHFLYRRGIILKNATGVIAISRTIENRTRAEAEREGLSLAIKRLPAVADTTRFVSTSLSAIAEAATDRPQFVWCGTVDGWIRDVLFLIDAFAKVLEQGYPCCLVIVGLCSEESRRRILAHATLLEVSHECIELAGWVSDERLSSLYRSATALLMPLWNDDRSLTRMPNKLPEYLCSGRLVISSEIGAVADVLQHEVTACLVPAGDGEKFASAMIRVIENPEWGVRLGLKGRELGVRLFDFRSYTSELGEFFRSCAVKRNVPVRLLPFANTTFGALRHLGCSAAALVLIGCGAVRRAKSRAFVPGTVTAIYFHKPSRELFLQCIRWLLRNGYQLISANDLVNFLRSGDPLPVGAAWLSFDDGAIELYRDVWPILREEKIPATIFIPSGIVAGDGIFPWLATGRMTGKTTGTARQAVTIAELCSMAAIPGITIGSHTVTHSKLPRCSAAQLNCELAESKRMLEEWLARPVQIFSYPNGDFDERSAGFLAGHGYRLAVTTESAFINKKTGFYHVPRFSVADGILLPEAICNMVGIWRPWVEPMKRVVSWIRDRSAPKFGMAASQR